MSKVVEPRMVEARVHVVRCDRCGTEIPTVDKGGGGQALAEGADISARADRGWVPLIPVTEASDAAHGREFNAANVDICGRCLELLQAWFLG